jgi:tyrosyl-tRNA synthetase
MSTGPDPIELLRARGFVQDVTDEAGLRQRFAEGPVTYYVGFDPTAASLHIGNLVGMMAMAWLQRLGHRPIALAGGATGRIGDPSFQDEERSLLDEDALARNLTGIRRDLGRVIDLSTPERGVLVDNFDWTRDVTVLDFLRDVGKHFSVNAMIAKEAVRKRLTEREHGISFTEFSYQLLQAMDFSHLYATEGCVLQGGGSDQWGNITAGIDLTRRQHGAQVYGLTWPLVERSDGRKFSKSTGTAVWLDPELTSPYTYYQWFLNVPDADVVRFLKLYTFLDLPAIDELAVELERDPAARVAHQALAREATRVIPGGDGVAQAEGAAAALFGGGALRGVDDATLAEAFEGAPTAELPAERLAEDGGVPLLEVLLAVGAIGSNSEGRRLVQQGGVRVNDVKVDDHERRLTPDDLASPTTVVLQLGKKRKFLARFV